MENGVNAAVIAQLSAVLRKLLVIEISPGIVELLIYVYGYYL